MSFRGRVARLSLTNSWPQCDIVRRRQHCWKVRGRGSHTLITRKFAMPEPFTCGAHTRRFSPWRIFLEGPHVLHTARERCCGGLTSSKLKTNSM